jgi:hypothetical protein
MQKSQPTYCALIAIAAGLIATRTAEAADKFRKLSDSEIRSKLAGTEITDDVHWAEQYMRDGSFKGFDMGRATKGRTWRAQSGELCVDNGTPDSGCREVWISSNKIEFREEGGFVLEGALEKQQPRKF